MQGSEHARNSADTALRAAFRRFGRLVARGLSCPSPVARARKETRGRREQRKDEPPLARSQARPWGGPAPPPACRDTAQVEPSLGKLRSPKIETECDLHHSAIRRNVPIA